MIQHISRGLLKRWMSIDYIVVSLSKAVEESNGKVCRRYPRTRRPGYLCGCKWPAGIFKSPAGRIRQRLQIFDLRRGHMPARREAADFRSAVWFYCLLTR